MIKDTQTTEFLEKMRTGPYYKKYNVSEEKIKEGLFSTIPCLGAALVSSSVVH